MILLMVVAAVFRWSLLLVTLPLVAELLGLTLASLFAPSPERSAAPSLDGQGPPFPPVRCLITVVPSHNEELSIARCVESLAAAGSAGNVLVVAHNCTDRTAEFAARAGARVEVLNDLSLKGKGQALKYGLAYAFTKAGADAVLIVDADSTVSPNITEAVVRHLSGTPVLQCRYQVRNHDASWRIRLVSLAFLGMNVIRPRGRDRLGLSCGIFGNGFAIRKEVLKEVEYSAHSIVEDLELHLVLIERGYRVRFVEEAFVLGDMPLSGDATTSQHARWEGGRVRLLSDWGSTLLRKTLSGRFLLLEPLIDLLSLPLGLEVLLLLVLLFFPSPVTRGYALFSFGVILFHLSVVVRASPDRRGSITALLCAPLYLFWRMAMIPSILRASRSGAAWVRTHRDSAPR